MKIIADFHIHSKYSRATSKDMDLDYLAQWAKWKGIQLMGTGDFTHPFWLAELKKKLEPLENGLFKYQEIYFILTTEVSSIYSQGRKVRKIHNLIFAPSLEAVEKINRELGKLGNLTSDGRPILGLSCQRMAELIFGISEACLIVPAHAWTPWFSLFGSMSGFDSIGECFGPYTQYIKTIETGLSSDPAMNWRLSKLDNVSLISCSDAHSPSKIGREACIFELESLSYQEIIKAINRKPSAGSKLLLTIEFFPQEGKYHYDGHRNCNILWSPKETKAHQGICPVCQRSVTIGVMHRVEQLADRSDGFIPENSVPFKNLIPLEEIIAEVLGQAVGTKSVAAEYQKLVQEFGSEFSVLLEVSAESLYQFAPKRIADGILRVREGKVKIIPGFDGEYGKIKIFEEKEIPQQQISLF